MSSRGVEDCDAGPVLVRLGSMVLTCADGGELAEHLAWSRWTATRATAAGVVTWRACTARRAQVTLTDPVAGPGKGALFTRLQLRVTVFTPAGFLRDLTFSETLASAVPSPSADRRAARFFASSRALGHAQIEGFWDDA